MRLKSKSLDHRAQEARGDSARNSGLSALCIDRATFYDEQKIAILPMGFCYPGTGKSGDLEPRTECAPLWRDDLMALLTNIRLTLVIGQYAMRWHLPAHT